MIYALATLIALAQTAPSAARGPERIEYTVTVDDPAARSFRVRARFVGLRQAELQVALPVWTPGDYEVKDYAANLSNFAAADAEGRPLPWQASGPSRWLVKVAGGPEATIAFDYRATDASSSGAVITERYAFFTGTQLFLEPAGKRAIPITVRFAMPPGWKIVSSLRPTRDSTVFRAINYDELVDSPTLLGHFSAERLTIAGQPHLIASAPEGAPCASNRSAFPAELQRIAASHIEVFGALPYDRYTIYCIEELSGGSIEHATSYVTGWLNPVNAAHELFHAWNVKRIRPAELWPYDYSQVAPGPSLWVSEGVTSYYEALNAFRAVSGAGGDAPEEGVGRSITPPMATPEERLLAHLAYRVTQVESHAQARTVSPSDASRSAGSATPRGPSYYHTGELLGLLLDLSIIDATDGARSLDDVMRILYKEYYQAGRGFRPADVIAIVNRLTRRDYTDFFRRHVTGTERPPYDSVLRLAGYTLSQHTRELGLLGVTARATEDGFRIYLPPRAQSPAATVALQVGDVITAVDDVSVFELPLTGRFGQNWIGGRFLNKSGQVVLTVKRGDAQLRIPVALRPVQEMVHQLESLPTLTPRQRMIRRAWLRTQSNPPGVDYHQHFFSRAAARLVSGDSTSPGINARDVIALLDSAGIQRALVASVAYTWASVNRPPVPNEYDRVKEENDWTAAQAAQFPDRLIAFCSVNPLKPWALDEIARCGRQPGLRTGLKLHFGNSDVDLDQPAHVAQVRKVFELANRQHMAIVAHVRTSINRRRNYGAAQAKVILNELLPAAPDVPIQIAHMAGAGGWGDAKVDSALVVFIDAIQRKDARVRNLWFDVAAVMRPGLRPEVISQLAERIRQIGVERVLYGTDAAGGGNQSPRDAWAEFRKLPLTPREFEIIAGNLAPYMRRPDR